MSFRTSFSLALCSLNLLRRDALTFLSMRTSVQTSEMNSFTQGARYPFRKTARSFSSQYLASSATGVVELLIWRRYLSRRDDANDRNMATQGRRRPLLSVVVSESKWFETRLFLSLFPSHHSSLLSLPRFRHFLHTLPSSSLHYAFLHHSRSSCHRFRRCRCPLPSTSRNYQHWIWQQR